MRRAGMKTISTIPLARAVVLLVILAAFGATDAAGSFELRRSSFSGSGGQSAGGSYTTRVTTSQPDAGVAAGGGFQVTGSIGKGDPAACTALIVAGGLVVSDDVCSGVSLGWIDTNTHEIGYRVKRDAVELAVTGPDVTGYMDTTAVAGITYTYSVVATNACGDAAPSSYAGYRPFEPVAPDNLVASVTGFTVDSVVVGLDWNENAADEIALVVYDLDSTRTVLKSLPPNTETTTVRVPRRESMVYCFEVAATNCSLEAVSDTACVATTGVPGDEDVPSLPAAFGLGRIGPNPSYSRVRIEFDVPREAPLSIRIYDLNGRVVDNLKDDIVSPGRHTLWWNGTNSRRQPTASGIYFVEMRAPGFRGVGRLVLLR